MTTQTDWIEDTAKEQYDRDQKLVWELEMAQGQAELARHDERVRNAILWAWGIGMVVWLGWFQ